MPQAPVSTTEILKKIPLFAALDEKELTQLVSCAGRRVFGQGEILFSEGDPCAGLYIVVSGAVRVFKTSANGREQVLTIDGPGSSIAEIPVFDGGPYPASAAAVRGDAELIFISRKDFRDICLQNPVLALKVLKVVGTRLRRLVGIIEELSFTTVRHRLISWLLRQAQAHGERFVLNASHQELASEIGTVRELVSRNLARLQAQDLIRINGREITIIDPAGLEADLSSAV